MMTFIYLDQVEEAKLFFEDCLRLEPVFEPTWARVYKVSKGGFLGIVDKKKGSLSRAYQGGSLVSLTVEKISEYYERVQAYGVDDLSEIKTFEDIGVQSFFFKGPGGYDFEIQMFTNEAIKKIFE